MTRLFITVAAALALAGPVFAKAHDQGVADGEIVFAPGEAQTIIPGPGISAVVNKGTQGEAKKDPENRGGVEPVVGKGRNAE
jgi:hypothetical protein